MAKFGNFRSPLTARFQVRRGRTQTPHMLVIGGEKYRVVGRLPDGRTVLDAGSKRFTLGPGGAGEPRDSGGPS